MDPKQKIAEIEARREARLADLANKEAEQRALDLEAREALEAEHGTTAEVKVTRYAPGFPTAAFVKTPEPVHYKRYVDMIGRAVEKKSAKDQRAASELLARACWVYPADDEARNAMLEKFPGLLTPISLAAAKLGEGAEAEEGKG